MNSDQCSVQTVGTVQRVNVSLDASYECSPVGDWKVYTSSINAVGQVSAQDPSTGIVPASGFNVGSRATLVSRAVDPSSNPISGAVVALTVWDQAGMMVAGPFNGTSNSQGWFNQTGVQLPPAPAIYRFQAAVVGRDYVGLKNVSVPVLYALTIKLTVSPGQSSSGSPVRLSGSVSPAKPGIAVTLQYRLAGSSEWKNIATVKTNANGEYSFTWAPSEGNYEVAASLADPSAVSSQSNTVQLIVGPSFPRTLLIIPVITAAAIVLGAFYFLVRRKRMNRRAGQQWPRKPL